jgi:hypothetical protein
MVCSAVAVVAVLRWGTTSTVTLGLTPAAPLTFAMAGGAFLLCTRAFRIPATYLTGIALIYAACHANVAFALDAENFEGQTQLVHLVLAASLSLVG